MKLPTIRQLPSGSWFCQLRLDGKSISITEPTEDLCKAKAMAYKTGILNAKKVPQSITLGAACDAYIDARRGVCSPSTIEGYQKVRNQYFQSVMGTKLSQLTGHALSLAVKRERQRVSRRGKPLSAKTIASALGFVKCVLNENHVDIDNVSAPEVKRKLVVIPSPDKVFPALVGSEIELACMLAAWLSLSMSEIRGLTKSRSILDGKLYLVDTKIRVKTGERVDAKGNKHGVYTDVLKEGGKEEERTRVLDIPPYIMNLINQVDGDVLVPLSVRQIERRFQNILSENNLPHMTFHQLRHLNASLMAMLKIQKEVARERGGWKTNYVMDRVYTHTFDQPRLEADRKINAYVEKQIANKMLTNFKKRRVYRLLKQ